MATIIVGELPRSSDPAVSEWGNPVVFTGDYLCSKSSDLSELLRREGIPGELKHLSTRRNRNQKRLP